MKVAMDGYLFGEDMNNKSADRAFDAFWAAYPNKTGKLAARREWDKLRPSPDLAQRIMTTLSWQKEIWDDPQFIPHPRTWLHQGRWDDERPANRGTARTNGPGSAPDAATTRAKFFNEASDERITAERRTG